MSERSTEKEPSTITIPRPAIHTGPAHKTVDEATADYLLEAAGRVVDQRIWGSGVSALVARTLTDAAMAIRASTPEAERVLSSGKGLDS